MENWINVTEANNKFKELSDKLTGRQLALSISRGINRTLMKGRTTARRAVKDEYNIPQKNLNGIDIGKSNPTTLTGNIHASAKPLPMDAFAPRFETSQRSVRVTKKGEQRIKDRKRKVSNPTSGVSIEVHRGSRVVIPFAFMIPGGKARVFARGEYRNGTAYGFQQRFKRITNEGNDVPIKPLISVTVHGAVLNPKAIAKIKQRLIDEYPKEIEHELKHRIEMISSNGV